ncbi:UDP-3-O-(3-hydroxymyristoyl)glucosamine N-acyltransferase [Lacibacterium aquatile]|uniref:UDP-3-O-(3-hydroxymyristoyl)glucosamine N-acyltransferase n=1 Tax=Lacibacterium aquatile TaxID=1168082 RepID=A0ABW5DZB8_9PROT
MSISVEQLLTILPADATAVGDRSRAVDGVATIGEGDIEALSFISATGDKAQVLFDRTRCGVIVTGPGIVNTAPQDRTQIIIERPRFWFIKLVQRFFTPAVVPGIHPTAVIDPSVTVGSDCFVGAHAVIGAGCSLGDRCVIAPNVTIYPGCRLGNDVVVNAGTVIGADGFGYERDADGTPVKFPHLGGVQIGDEVEIGSNTSIDRGTIGDTIIGRGVKIDNQCHISHNVKIGDGAFVIAQSMIGGSVKIGRNAWIAPSVAIRNQIPVGDDAIVGMGAVVVKAVEAGTTVAGVPAKPLPSKD